MGILIILMKLTNSGIARIFSKGGTGVSLSFLWGAQGSMTFSYDIFTLDIFVGEHRGAVPPPPIIATPLLTRFIEKGDTKQNAFQNTEIMLDYVVCLSVQVYQIPCS